MVLTSIGGWWLAAHQQFSLAYQGLHAMAAIYLLLMGYHLLMIF
jgi:hypothetical protein